MFSSEEKEIENEVDISLVKAKSSFHPPRNKNACLDKTVEFLQQQTFQTSCNNKLNLTKAEWKDLLALKNNSELIIKETDKGGSMVLMNKPHYKRMIFQHLNDASTYQKTDQKCDNRVMKKKGELAKKYESLLTKAEKLYFTNISFSTTNFYGLPKVHKSKQINESVQQKNNECIEIHEPDDLIVIPRAGGPNCPTRPLSQLIYIILKPFLIHVKSYVKDNLDILRKDSRKNNDSTTHSCYV